MIILSAAPGGTRVTYTQDHRHDELFPTILVEDSLMDAINAWQLPTYGHGSWDVTMVNTCSVNIPRFHTIIGTVFKGGGTTTRFIRMDTIPWYKLRRNVHDDCWEVVNCPATPTKWKIEESPHQQITRADLENLHDVIGGLTLIELLNIITQEEVQ